MRFPDQRAIPLIKSQKNHQESLMAAAGSVAAGAAGVGHPPDRIRSVVGDEERAIGGHRYAHRPGPDLAVGRRKAGDKILVGAGGLTVFHGHADDFITRAVRAVPGTVLRCENLALVFGRELIAFVEGDFQRRIVWLQEHVGNNDFIFELGMLAFVARVLVAAGVIPGPSVKAAILNVSYVIRRDVVAERVALVGGTPEVAGFRLDGFANAIANPGGVDAHAGAVGIELQP